MQGRLIMRQPTLTICTNGNCAPKSVAAALLLHLQTRIRLEPALGHVIANTIECFGVCHSGPIACIQPGGRYYEQLDAALLDKILDEHILQGLPISTHCLLQRTEPTARRRSPSSRQSNPADN